MGGPDALIVGVGLDGPCTRAAAAMLHEERDAVAERVAELAAEQSLRGGDRGAAGEVDQDDLLVVENGILNLADLTLTPHTPQLFSVVKLPYQFDATALCPAWLQFVNSVWDDPDEIALAQEIAGYALEAENWLQVLFLLQGAMRGGKGVLLRMLCQMVGEGNTCSISARNFCKDFALWGARGKAIITVPDISAPKHGLPPELVEILKAITGNDALDVNGKRRPADTAGGLLRVQVRRLHRRLAPVVFVRLAQSSMARTKAAALVRQIGPAARG